MFFERPQSGELAILVHLELSSEEECEDPREFEELALAAGGDPVQMITGRRNSPNARYFVGSGKVDEIREAVVANKAELVLFNHALSPSQERNLEAALQCRVLDRTGLILDIFAQRARTHEGKLQVELAQLRHMSTRLIRGWTHLERQKGGIGLRGPGETQLETDRRLLRARIKNLLARLDRVHKQRAQGRRSRKRAAVQTVSVVGYTNAGKSTLFNNLTGADAFVADQLFATLDPTMRRLNLTDIGPIVLADTVGFISHLPHKLVEAFKATLEEAAEADLLLHVVDASDENRLHNIEQVNEVLKEIHADKIVNLMVYNKIDLLEPSVATIERDEQGKPVKVCLSAKTGQGFDLLEQAIAELLRDDLVEISLALPPQMGRLRARLYAQASVKNETIADDGKIELDIKIPKSDLQHLLDQEKTELQSLLKH